MKVRTNQNHPGLEIATAYGKIVRPTPGVIYEVTDEVGNSLVSNFGFERYDETEVMEPDLLGNEFPALNPRRIRTRPDRAEPDE